jgi:hypothetical protein
MRIIWRRGLLRAWVVLACMWVAAFGWLEGSGFDWRRPVQTTGECWDQFARWADARGVDPYEIFLRAADVAGDAEINRKNHAENSWLDAAEQQIRDCEADWPMTRRLTLWLLEDGSALGASLAWVFVPPLMLLGLGFVLGWVVRGFGLRRDESL